MKKKKVIFTLVMAGSMSLVMSICNSFFMNGISDMSLLFALKNWWFRYLCGFTLVFLFISKIAFYVADLLFGEQHNVIKNFLAVPTFTVMMMVPMMTSLSLLYANGGVCDNFMELYLRTMSFNFMCAWVSQVVFVGPSVKWGFAQLNNLKKPAEKAYETMRETSNYATK